MLLDDGPQCCGFLCEVHAGARYHANGRVAGLCRLAGGHMRRWQWGTQPEWWSDAKPVTCQAFGPSAYRIGNLQNRFHAII